MPAALLPISRFPLPDDWEPEGVICVTFVIPDDPQYLATLTGLVDSLKWSRSFARDETGTGAAIVSRTWQTALESEPFATRGCDVPEFRLNDVCLLEVNCGTDDEPNWQPVFTAPHAGGDPGVPYPEGSAEYEADTARCIAAANITAQLKLGTDTLANDAAIVGGVAVALIDLIGAFLFFVPGGILVDIAIAAIDFAVGHTADEFASDYTDIDWLIVRDEIVPLLNRDGSMSEEGRTELLAWMATQYSGNLAWGLAQIIVNNVTADGLTLDARMPQNEIDTDCPDACEGEMTTERDYSFATSDDEFYAVVDGGSPTPMGVYTSGAWHTTYYPGPDNAVAIVRDLTRDTLITRLKLFGELTGGYPNRNMTILAHRVVEDDFIELAQITEFTTPNLDYGTNSCEWIGCLLIDQIKFICSFSQGLGGDAQWLTAYECDYIGSDPF